MSSNFKLDDLGMIGNLLDKEDIQNQRRRHRRFAVHKTLKKRQTEGEFWTIFPQLMDDEQKFYQYFRMPQFDFHVLLEKIANNIKKKNTTFKQAISPKEKLAVCLRFLSTGDSYKTIALSYKLGHSTVSKIVIEVCDAIIKILLSEFMPIPNEGEWLKIADEFWKMWNFPNCIGALDGKHVPIAAPFNKITSSIVLLALVDANYRFIAVDVGSYGKNSGEGIFAHSNLGKSLALNKLNVPGNHKLPNTNTDMPHVIVADEAFPLKNYLLRPYPRAQLQNADNTKQQYNYRHSRARRVSENSFGILTQKFGLYNRRLQLKPEYVDKVILTTCILHNFIIETNHFEIPAENEQLQNNLQNLPYQGGSGTSSAFHIRDTFANFFSSEAGTIDSSEITKDIHTQLLNLDNEKLIECVKEHNFLYNQENKYYSDNIKKDRAWEEIGTIVKLSGPECKKQWNKLRDGYRRAIKRIKQNKSGQAATNQIKWKYEEVMSFLMPYMRERETITSVVVDLGQDIIDDVEMESVNEDTNYSYETREHLSPAGRAPFKKLENETGKIENETASSTLMTYLLSKDNSDQTNEIDFFFKSMAEMVKKMSPFNQSLAKSRVFRIVSELEMEQLTQQQPLEPDASVTSQREEGSSYSSSDNLIMHPPSPSRSYTAIAKEEKYC